ncbi:hypothetical protein [Paraburkholderia sp. BL10I2N1]|uniref:hypothetical protein n=1 Tax=Paraburkholderia sp. BL10I2N1 TaxID=1938796 RepID=UPI001FB69DB5|nr:hypothetical protein [Paraburkholderia sp. BL10I2N1]
MIWKSPHEQALYATLGSTPLHLMICCACERRVHFGRTAQIRTWGRVDERWILVHELAEFRGGEQLQQLLVQLRALEEDDALAVVEKAGAFCFDLAHGLDRGDIHTQLLGSLLEGGRAQILQGDEGLEDRLRGRVIDAREWHADLVLVLLECGNREWPEQAVDLQTRARFLVQGALDLLGLRGGRT